MQANSTTVCQYLPLVNGLGFLRPLLPPINPDAMAAQAAAPADIADASLAYTLIEHSVADRASVEQFISRCFEQAYGSRIRAFMPRLFSLRDGDGNIVGAFGLRSASHRLYLEQYLEHPIEQSIRALVGANIDREFIVEVGHFSGSAPGSVRAMIFRLTEYLHRQGFEWVAFTGTSTLRNAFHRMGLAPIDICAAVQDRLPPQERAAWGSYYDYAPHVLVGNVGQGYRTLLPEASR